ncbi:MAG: CBS domain-containing protein [Marinilabiliaceae bacterium]|nr:CBS domain-containing protein [Marinilabiliaceae bacterium]
MKLVREYMTKDIVAVCNSSTVKRVIEVMVLHRLCAVPVVNKIGEYIGCISESDILNEAMPTYMKSIANTSVLANIDLVTNHLGQIINNPASDFIDKEYPIVKPDDTLSYAADLLFRSKRTMLPVVTGNELIGFFSRLDFLSIPLVKDD